MATTTSLRALESVERAATALPVSIPAALRNRYHRLILETDFEGYAHPPDPFALRWVDPERIERFTSRPYPPYRNRVADLGSVRDGDWDRRSSPPIADDRYRDRYDLYRGPTFTESVFFQSLEAHFRDGVPWERTPFVTRCLELAAADRPSWRSLDSNAAILERCRRIDELYESIRTDGYRTQRELGVRSIMRVTDEIVVDVGRDGTILFVNGRHRLAIAKLLDLEAVPVCVLVRHGDWMAHRDRLGRRGELNDHPHPDLP